MPEFVSPFKGASLGRHMTPRELTRAIRLSLSAEEEAIHLYEAMADSTDSALARTVLQDIANEERVHVGEFQELLQMLLADEQGFMAEGAEEVREMARDVGAGGDLGTDDEAGVGAPPSIGDLRGVRA